MITPSPAELEILQVLWQLGEAKVQVVNDKLSEIKPVGYTTTLKTMQIMEQKGLLGRERDGKSHIYFPLIAQADTQSTMLEKLLQSAFGGSKSQLVMQLLGNKKVSRKELNEIKQFLDNLEK
ncbi:MAG TPA: BlaI/MecI/CopY family transcriptional regulator [Cellvibrio sp.]|nr:BlaI/MecI/CopY family transcriptional regulator [Cellvibrio sp.]